MMDDAPLKTDIYAMLEDYASTSVTKKISSIIELLKITAHVDELAPQTDRIHLANGTLFLDGRFTHEKNEIVRSRFPVRYTPDAEPPAVWLRFLDELLYAEDIPCLQEYIGYCLIPQQQGTADDANQGQRRRRKEPDWNGSFALVRVQCEERKRRKGVRESVCPRRSGTHSPDD